MTALLITPSGAYDRQAIMSKAWRDYRSVRARGDESMSFGDWLRNAWRVAKSQRATTGRGALPRCFPAKKSLTSGRIVAT